MNTNKSEESRIILFNIRAPFFFIWKIEGAETAISFLFNSYLFPPVYSRLEILEIRIV